MIVLALTLLCASQQADFGAYDGISEFRPGSGANDLRLRCIGDVDHDGCDDYLASDHTFEHRGDQLGIVWLVTGKTGVALAEFRGTRDGERAGAGLTGLGDLDQDGELEYAFGVPSYDEYGSRATAGRVEVRSGTAGVTRYTLLGLNVADGFGSGLGALGDIDGDGAADFFVSAPDDLVGSLGWAGRIAVYSGRGGNLLYSLGGWYGGMRLSASGSVGDLDGDGIREIAGYSLAASEHYFFSGSTGQLLLTLPRGSYTDEVAPLADLDGDGVDEFAIRREHYSVLQQNAGRLEVWSGRTATILYALDGRQGDLLGSGVSVLGDLDDDRIPELAVGCTGRNHAGILNAGAIFIVSGASGAVLDVESRHQRKERFGNLRDAGDFDGDGQPDMLIAILGTRSYYQDGVAASFRRSLMIHPNRMSVAQGGTATLAVSHPAGQPYLPYRLLLSGTGPGSTQWHGVTIPLQPDSWSIAFLNHPPAFFDFPKGTLDAFGRAKIRFTLPPQAVNLAGRRIDFAVLTTDFRGAPTWCSSSASLLFDP